MRLIRYAALLLLIGCSAVTTYAQDNKDHFVKKVFEVLQTRDREIFTKLFPSLETYKEIVIAMAAKISGDDPEEGAFAKEVSGWTQKDYDTILLEVEKNFKSLVRRGEKRGVDWPNSRMINWVENKIGDDTRAADGEFRMLGGKINFVSKGKEFIIEFEDILWYEPHNRWYGVQFDQVYEKGKEVEAMREDMKEPEPMMSDNSADTIAVAADTTAVPVPVQPKNIPKKTPPSKTTKPGTAKPPVRKDN